MHQQYQYVSVHVRPPGSSQGGSGVCFSLPLSLVPASAEACPILCSKLRVAVKTYNPREFRLPSRDRIGVGGGRESLPAVEWAVESPFSGPLPCAAP